MEGLRLYERVLKDLATQIARGDYQVGDRLPAERKLAQIYGVSRPTVREAIIGLEVDGMVEVKTGSGVYVIASTPESGDAAVADVGPFELLEARRAIEAEACAIAATRITDDELAELDRLLLEMKPGEDRDLAHREDADRQIHMVIAKATQNSAMFAVVEQLWEIRSRSPQYRHMIVRAHAAGVGPILDEHQAIVEALRSRDAVASRNAMANHLTRVLDTLLEATEVREMEEARQRVAAHRQKYTAV